MPLFSYRAVNSDGTSMEGTMDEVSAARVAAILDERGLQVSSVEPITRRAGLIPLKRQLSWADIEALNDQLLAVTKSRLPLVSALESMIHDVRSPRLRSVLSGMQADLEQGATMDEALDRQADAIPYMYRNLVRAGERSGNLPGVLSLAATHSRRMIAIRNNLQMTLAYPAIVCLMAAAFSVIFLYYIMPMYKETYADFGNGLPAMTQFWVDVSDSARANTVPLILLAIFLVAGTPVALRIVRRFDNGSYLIDWTRERIPVVGKTYGFISVSRFARSLGTLLASGVSTVEALDLSAAAAGNGSLRRAVREATERVSAGERIADALSDTGYFTHTFCWLLSTGEQRGEVESALFSVADTYDRQIERRDRQIEFLMLPVVIVFIGLALGAMITSIYLPMFSMY